jgi:hypothetical protein
MVSPQSPRLSPVMQAAQVAGAGVGPLQPNHNPDIKKPILLVRGTNEKGFVPWDNVIDSVDNRLVPDGTCPVIASARDVVACYLDNATFPTPPTFPKLGQNEIISTAKATVDWYVAHNHSVERGVESLYPDLGHGSSFAKHEGDATMAVRQDFQRRPGDEDSAAVARITIIDGFHQWPGRNGNAPPCSKNCDVDMTKEILQFWRANAGLVTRWP